MTLFQNGDYAFNGNFHDSGAPSYDLDFAWMVVSGSGRAYSFAHKGHMAGTFESGSRDEIWTNQGNNSDIAAHWADLCGAWSYDWTAYVNWNVQAAVNAVVNALQAAGTVVAAVVAVVAVA